MRTALASSVAAAAKWIPEVAPLGLQAVPERRQVYIESLLIMKTVLAASVATVAKEISGAVLLGVQAAPERRSV